jgi:hypothetical protein
MTSKRWLNASVVSGLSVLLALPAPVLAEPSVRLAQSQDVNLGAIREAIVQAIALDGTVDVSMKSTVLNVSLVNASLNKTGHSPRNNEAARIGSIVSQAISGKPEFRKIHTIRIHYVARADASAKGKIIDAIDFRKDASGVFQFHAT